MWDFLIFSNINSITTTKSGTAPAEDKNYNVFDQSLSYNIEGNIFFYSSSITSTTNTLTEITRSVSLRLSTFMIKNSYISLRNIAILMKQSNIYLFI